MIVLCQQLVGDSCQAEAHSECWKERDFKRDCKKQLKAVDVQVKLWPSIAHLVESLCHLVKKEAGISITVEVP